MSSTTHISPTQDTGGNVNYLPNSCNISDISMISVYWSDIMNKPGFCNVSITGSYNDLLNVPSLSTVAFSGDYNSLSNRPWINSNSNIYNNNQGNVGIGTNNPTEKLHLVGNFSISGDIIPAINSNFNLGSSNYKWKDLYLSGNSIYLDNLIISKNSSNNLEIRDSDNNLRSISLNQLELNDGDNKLRFLYSNGALVFNSNGINIQGIEFSNYSKIIYSNNLYTTSNTIIDYTNYRINNLNFNTGGGGNGATININTDTIQIGTSNKFITSNIYDSNITFMNNLNVNGSYQLNNCNIPFSLMKFTNITTTNGVFTYNASSNDFGYFSFVNSGTITFPQMTDCDVLVVGAGGNGGTGTLSGGGGAGEVIAYPSYSFPSGTYTIQVGTSGTSSNNRISKISSNSVDFLLAKGGADGYGIQSNITSTTLKYGISNNTLIDYNYSNLTTLSSGTSNFIFSTDGSIIITSNNYSSVSTLTPRNWYKFDDPSNIGIDSGSSPVNLSVVNTSPSFDTNNVIKGASSMLNIRNTTTPNYLRANINLSTPFTIAFWFYMNSDNDHAPFGLATNQSGTSPLISCQYVTTNDKELTTYLAAPSLWTAFGTDNIIITHFRWYHYVLTVSSANPTVCTVYINGVLSKSQNGTGAFNTNSGVNTLFVNIRGDISASMPFGGNIDDFRIYSSVLTASQVSELFNSTIDRSYPILRSINNDEITPIAWYKFDNNLTDMVNDSSVNGFTLTNTSVTFNSTKFAKGNGAAEMSTTNYFSSTNATLTSYIHQNSYSISCWIYPKSTTNGFSLSFGGNGAIRQWVGYGCFLASRYGFAHVGVTTGTQDLYSSAYAQDLNTWVHVTFTFDKNTSARVIYRNGVSIANTTSGALTLSQNLFYVGRYIDTSTLPMNGLIDDLRIYNFALSEAQVQELYQGRLRIFASSSNNQGGSGGGGATNINLTTSIGSKWNSNYSYISSGYIGTSNQGGNGGGANSNMGLTTSLVTGSALTIGEGGLGATSTSIPISKNTYGSGGDGNGGTGTNGIVIIKVPLNTCNVKFDGFIYSSNIFDLNYNTITLMSFASNQLNASIVNTSNKLIDYDNLIDKPWINSNLIIYNNNQGNVGIGTNNPISKLDVSGDINFTGTLKLNQRTLPFSVYSNTNILSSNGLFSYIPNNVFFGYYTFLTNGTITFPQTTSCDIIVVGAGGNGGINNLSGGGGAGEVIAYQGYSFTTGIYNIQIGTTNDINSSNLRNSIISSNNSALITAKGGGDGAYTIYNISGSGSYLTSNLSSNNIYFAFTSNVSSLVLYESITCDILVVGGGGAGGQRSGGGGGAGALIYQTNKTLNAGNYSITVGSGGAGAPITTSITPSSGNDGGDSIITYNGTAIYIAKGGGGGANNATNTGRTGGSGGGNNSATAALSTVYNTENEPDGIYGNIGGAGGLTANGSYAAGGGGGAGAVGGSFSSAGNSAGNGGAGVQINITGTNQWYAGGGGGGIGRFNTSTGGSGGSGIGGAGAVLETTSGGNGVANTGSGGGGAGFGTTTDQFKTGSGASGSGGSGIVIIRFNLNTVNTIAYSGGSGGGGLSSSYSNVLSNAAVAGTKWNNTYSFVTNGSNGTLTRGGNGGSALSNIGYTETITSNSFVLGVGGLGATSNSVPSLKTTYGSGGDGNGGLGTQGIVIIKVPLNIQRPIFDGYINYSNIDNRPVLNELLSTNNYLNIGYYNQVNFPLGDVSWNNEWFLYIGRSPTSVQNSFIFWHLTSNINSKWWFNGTQTSTNNEISDARIKKEITEIQNPLDKLMLIKPKEYYLCDEKDYLRKYGVIAQDVASNQELSHLVYKDDDFIANVYTTATYVSSPKILLITTTSIIGKVAVDDELKLLLDNMNIENIEIIIEETPYHNRYKKRYVKVKEIIDEFTIEIYEEIELSENEKSNILIYGKRVNDFNKLDYSSLYSLNIACTQELYKIIQEQKNKIDELEQRIIQLENR